MLRQAITIDAVRVAPMKGLLVEFAASEGAHAVVRGLRAISDFEFEFQMALMNRKLDPEIETIFLMPKEEYTYLSSRIVKEIARLGGDVSAFVPSLVAEALAKKFNPELGNAAAVICTSKNLPRENSFESNPAGRPASGRRRRLSARRHRDAGNSLRWTDALQPRPWNFRWRPLGQWDDRANGSAELRGLPRKVRARNQGSGVCAPHRIARA